MTVLKTTPKDRFNSVCFIIIFAIGQCFYISFFSCYPVCMISVLRQKMFLRVMTVNCPLVSLTHGHCSCCCYCFRQQSPNTLSWIWKEGVIVVARCSGYFTCGWQFGRQSDNSVVGVHTSLSESFIQIILYITFIPVSYLTCFTWSENQEEWHFYS